MDLLAEVSRRWSPYTYCYNNPSRFIDPDGMTSIKSGDGDGDGGNPFLNWPGRDQLPSPKIETWEDEYQRMKDHLPPGVIASKAGGDEVKKKVSGGPPPVRTVGEILADLLRGVFVEDVELPNGKTVLKVQDPSIRPDLLGVMVSADLYTGDRGGTMAWAIVSIKGDGVYLVAMGYQGKGIDAGVSAQFLMGISTLKPSIETYLGKGAAINGGALIYTAGGWYSTDENGKPNGVWNGINAGVSYSIPISGTSSTGTTYQALKLW